MRALPASTTNRILLLLLLLFCAGFYSEAGLRRR